MRIGLFGGTFDPIHIGHLILAQECWHKLSLDKVIFIPSYIPPHKELAGDISVADRLNLVRHALEGDNRFEISTYEIDSKDTSYTINTVEHFKQEYGNDELYFLAGADWAETLIEWKNIEKILELVNFVIVTRPGWTGKCAVKDEVQFVEIPAIDISSTEIRERIAERCPIDYFVPGSVVRVIRDKGLYK